MIAPIIFRMVRTSLKSWMQRLDELNNQGEIEVIQVYITENRIWGVLDHWEDLMLLTLQHKPSVLKTGEAATHKDINYTQVDFDVVNLKSNSLKNSRVHNS